MDVFHGKRTEYSFKGGRHYGGQSYLISQHAREDKT